MAFPPFPPEVESLQAKLAGAQSGMTIPGLGNEPEVASLRGKQHKDRSSWGHSWSFPSFPA